MSVLLCAGKLTYPIKHSTDLLGIEGVSYVEFLDDYLKFNQQIEKIIFIETVENQLCWEDITEYGFKGELTIITNTLENYTEDKIPTSEGRISINEPKLLEGIRVSDIQWELMNS